MICVLTGGTGGAKFVDGLRQVVPPEEITLVVNTGDDLLWWGLYVSPDIDSITYVLSDLLSRERDHGEPQRPLEDAGGRALVRDQPCRRAGELERRDLTGHVERLKLASGEPARRSVDRKAGHLARCRDIDRRGAGCCRAGTRRPFLQRRQARDRAARGRREGG